MKKFEFYHPILTQHVVLDWLTHSKVKDIFELRHHALIAQNTGRAIDTSIEKTIGYINHVMHLIMNNEALIWGITDQTSHQFLGTFTIYNFDQNNQTASIILEYFPQTNIESLLNEVLKRMLHFGFEELGLQQLNVSLSVENTTTTKLFKQFGFTLLPKTNHQTRQHYQLQKTSLDSDD